MLKRLFISNFALINEMDVVFPGDLTVITGETGAGKSIFLEALGLALGKRAETGAVKNKSKKCIIEAEFQGVKGLGDFFSANDLEPSDSLILRREINADGKSRSFVNDSLVNLNSLKSVSEHLIDIHSQHQTLLLNKSDFQLSLIDAFAENSEPLRDYKSRFSNLTKLKTELRQLEEQEQQSKKESDYFQFLYNEFTETEIKSGLLKRLEEESSMLENAETIKEGLLASAQQINGGEPDLLLTLSQIRQTLGSLARFSPEYKGFYDRLNSAYVELKELAGDLDHAGNSVSCDREQLEIVNAKLDKLNRLFKKHGVRSEEELLKIKADLEDKLETIGSLEGQIEKTKKELAKERAECESIARRITEMRQKAIAPLEESVKSMLAELSMENATLKIQLLPQTDLTSDGAEKAQILFNANKGGQLTDLSKVASGGELSRLMLSLKALMATRKQLPAIVFDEIDTGVSGDVADKIGNILMKMSRSLQVITITHLPQMASKGNHHLFVYKKDEEEATSSFIKELNKEERVSEIAKMLSTSNPTQSALKNAKELLKAAAI